MLTFYHQMIYQLHKTFYINMQLLQYFLDHKIKNARLTQVLSCDDVHRAISLS